MSIMTRTKFLLTISSVIVAWSMAVPVKAWVAAGYRGFARGGYGVGCYHGAYGGSAAWSHGVGYASGYRGTATWNHGSGYATGRYGGSASWNHGSGYATGRYGGTASWGGGSGSYHGAYGRSASWTR